LQFRFDDKQDVFFRCSSDGSTIINELVDQKAVGKLWAQRGFSCGVWTDPPGQRWEDFVHTTDEIVMVIDGTVEFEISGKIHQPHQGEELFIPAGAVHSVRNIGGTTAHWFYGYRREKPGD
jgi:quercetin dioxygenase-like cupin family protein